MFQLMDISVQLIQFTDQQKGTRKVTWRIYRPDEEKLKKNWKVGTELSIDDITKIPQIYTLPKFLSMSEQKLWNLLTRLI